MSEPEQQDSNQDFPETSENSAFAPGEEILQAGSQPNQANTPKDNKEEKTDKCCKQIVVNCPQGNDAETLAEMKEQSRIGRIGLIMNGIIGFLTLGALAVAIWSIQVSNKALGEAKKSNTLTKEEIKANKELNEKNYNLSKEIADSSDVMNKQTIDVANKSLNEQVNSIKEAAAQFKANNMAFLECKGIRVIQFEADKAVKIIFQISNAGKAPVKVIRFKLGFFAQESIGVNPSGYLRQIFYDPYPTAFYIASQSFETKIFTGLDVLPKDKFEQIKRGDLGMIFFGEIEYVNEINKTPTKCIFNILAYPPPSIEYRIIFLENVEDK